MDNWEDWDNDDTYCVPNEEQLKQLNERKLVEESDNALTKNLFEDDLAYQEFNKYEHKNNISVTTNKKPPKNNLISKKKENEEKQKEISKMTKEYKSKKEREKELFGEAKEDEYAQYENMFY